MRKLQKTQMTLVALIYCFILAASACAHVDDLPRASLPARVSFGISDQEDPLNDCADDLQGPEVSGGSRTFPLILSHFKPSLDWLPLSPSLHQGISILRC